MIHLWLVKKKNEKGMLHLNICEKEDNHKFPKHSLQTGTFVNVTFF